MKTLRSCIVRVALLYIAVAGGGYAAQPADDRSAGFPRRCGYRGFNQTRACG